MFSAIFRRAIGAILATAFLGSLLAVTTGSVTPMVASAAPFESAACADSVQGTVYRDVDADGIKDRTSISSPVNNAGDMPDDEFGEPNITVTAFDASGAVVDTTTTGNDGTYTLAVPTGVDVRVEFSWAGTWLQSGPLGPDSASATQFVAGGTCDVDLGVLAPAQFCGTNPFLATSCFAAGAFDGANSGIETLITSEYEWGTSDPLNDGTLNSGNWASHYQTDEAGVPTMPNKLGEQGETGATFGLTWNRSTNELFASSVMRVAIGYGPGGPGAIYSVNVDPATGAATSAPAVFATLPASRVCADTHSDDLDTNDWDTAENTVADNAAFDSVGKCSLGGLAMAHDDSAMYVMALGDRHLVKLSSATGNEMAAFDTTAAPLPGCPDVATDFRPFAVAQHDGDIFIGSVCTGESTGAVADSHAYVHRLDEAAGTFDLVFTFEITADRGPGGWPQWQAWTNDIPTFVSSVTSTDAWSTRDGETFGALFYPQPLLSDLAFDGQQMVLGLKSRTADQFGYPARIPDLTAGPNGSGVTLYHVAGEGDLSCAGLNADGTYTLAAAGQCGSRTASNVAGSTTDPNEFYADGGSSNFGTGHDEAHSGGVALVPGLPLVQTMTDPTEFMGQSTPRILNNGGFGYMDNSDGSPVRGYVHYLTTGSNGPTFGKANGLGDVEALCEQAPVELGNRIWMDANNDGIQDPGEAPIAGVTVNLFDSSGVLVATAVTDANGNYSFVGDTAPSLSGAASQGVVAGGIEPTETYTIRLDNPADYLAGGPLADLVLTQANQGSNDEHDSDAVTADTLLVGADYPEITVPPVGSAGNNDHREDFGFTTGTLDLALAKTVVSAGPFAVGSTVEFAVTVTNQGDLDADTIVVSDYVPAGYVFNAADNTDFVLASGTTATGPVTVSAAVPVLAVDDDITLSITLVIAAGTEGTNLENRAEISNYDTDNDPGTPRLDDRDSVADTSPTNDPGGQAGTDADDEIDGDGTGVIGDGVAGTDEDDADPAVVTVADVVQPGSAELGNRLWYDLNNNGLQDLNETGVPGQEIFLLDSSGNQVASTTTDADGYYIFTDLEPGEYSVTFTKPAGYEFSDEQDAGSDDDVDSDVDTSTGQTVLITLVDGDSDMSWDAGIWMPASPVDPVSLGDTVWLDTDRDGVQDDDEEGVSGVEVTLLDPSGNVIATTTTDADGHYEFTDLTPGDYVVQIEQPTGMVFTIRDADAPTGITSDEVDSDVDPANGRTGVIVLGDTDDWTNDAGIYPTEYDLVLVKTLVSSNPSAKTALWRITVTNNGPDAAAGPITVTDNLPSSLTFVSQKGTDATCLATGQAVTCTHVGALLDGESFVVEIETSYVLAPGASVSNQASVVGVGSTTTEVVSTNNDDSAVLSVTRTNTPELAFSGSESWALASLAILLLASGSVLVLLGRRRNDIAGS